MNYLVEKKEHSILPMVDPLNISDEEKQATFSIWGEGRRE